MRTSNARFFVSNYLHTKNVRTSSQEEYATSSTRAPACCSSRDRLILTTSSYDAKTPMSDRVCVPRLLQRCGGKNAFQFPELIATSPLKKEGTFANEEAWQ